MERLFIDESGSMTVAHSKVQPYFVIAIIRANDTKALKKTYKYFIKKNLKNLQKIDTDNKMFKNGRFLELKGNVLTPKMKRKFVEFFCGDKSNNSFEVFYIVIDNREATQKFYNDTTKAFNYVIKLALEYYIKHGFINGKERINIQIDERNESPESCHFLQDYLNTELYLNDIASEPFDIKYFDSADNYIVQIADVFANLYYSQLMTNTYLDVIDELKKRGYIKHIFRFPLK